MPIVNYKIVPSLETYFDSIAGYATTTSPTSGDVEITRDGADGLYDFHRKITSNETEAAALDSELATALTDTNNESANVEFP